jgi:hypothetical protein
MRGQIDPEGRGQRKKEKGKREGKKTKRGMGRSRLGQTARSIDFFFFSSSLLPSSLNPALCPPRSRPDPTRLLSTLMSV